MLRKLWFNLAYLRKPIWDTGVSPQELIDFLATNIPGKALDMGCGTGTNVITMAMYGWTVTGVDFTHRAIRKARQKVQQKQLQVDLRVDDVTRLLGFSGPFDLILDMGCYHSLPVTKRQAYISNVYRLLADKGTFLLYTFVKTRQEQVGPGATEADLQFISQKLRVIERKDSTERGIRPSAWLTIQKKS